MFILGIIKESGTKHKGLIEIPNLSEENEVDDTEVRYFLLNQASALSVEHLKTLLGCASCAVVSVSYRGLICQGLLYCGGSKERRAE